MNAEKARRRRAKDDRRMRIWSVSALVIATSLLYQLALSMDGQLSTKRILEWKVDRSDEVRAKQVAIEYLTHYVRSEPVQMYALTAPQVRSKISEKDFIERVSRWRSRALPTGIVEQWEACQCGENIFLITTVLKVVPQQGKFKGHVGRTPRSLYVVREGVSWFIAGGQVLGNDGLTMDSLPIGPVVKVFQACLKDDGFEEISDIALDKAVVLLHGGKEHKPAKDLREWWENESANLTSEGMPYMVGPVDYIAGDKDQVIVRAGLIFVPQDFHRPCDVIYGVNVIPLKNDTASKAPLSGWTITRIERLGTREMTNPRLKSMIGDSIGNLQRSASQALGLLLSCWKGRDNKKVLSLTDDPYLSTIRGMLKKNVYPVSWSAPEVVEWTNPNRQPLRVSFQFTLTFDKSTSSLKDGRYYAEIGGVDAPVEWKLTKLNAVPAK